MYNLKSILIAAQSLCELSNAISRINRAKHEARRQKEQQDKRIKILKANK